MKTKAIIYFITLFITGIILGYLMSQFVQGVLSTNLRNLIAPLILATMVVVLVNTLLQLFSRPATTPQTVPVVNVESDTDIPSQLINMLSGDLAAAEQLIEQAKRNHPGQPEAWYWQKAFEDVQQTMNNKQ